MQQNKIRTYLLYAIGEIFLVVIGILIALQVNNWNQDLKDRREENRLLNAIQLDLERDIQQLNNIINQARLRQAQADTILAIMYKNTTPNQSEFLRLNRASIAFENHFSVNSGTFDESQSAGSVKLIEDDDIRQQIFTYYRKTKLSYTDRNTIKQIYEEVFPVFFRKVVATKSGIAIWKDIDTNLPELNISKLSQDPDYIAMMTTKVAAEMFQIQEWQTFLTDAENLRSTIQKEIEDKR